MRIGHVISPDGLLHHHSVKAKGQMPLDIDSLVARLAEQPGLAGFSVLPRDDRGDAQAFIARQPRLGHDWNE